MATDPNNLPEMIGDRTEFVEKLTTLVNGLRQFSIEQFNNLDNLQEVLSEGSFVDGDKNKLDNIEPNATADQTGAEIKNLYESEGNTNAFTDSEKSKLSQIEPNATADQTGAEIKSLYESESNTNAFTDAEKTKLLNIEDNATGDQTGAEIKSLYESEPNTNAFTDAEKSKLAALESSRFLGTYTNLSALELAHPNPASGSYAYVDGGVGEDTQEYIWDESDSSWVIGGGSSTLETPSSIKTKYESNPDTNAFTDSEKTKLSQIEPNATGDQTGAEIKTLYELEPDTNAFTDSEKTKLAGVEPNATADQTGAEIKSLYESQPDTNAYTDSEKTKLAGVELNATADQTGAEIKSLYESEPNTNAFTDAEKSKLAGLESSKFVGTYISLSALETAHPTASSGSYAYVDSGAGVDAVQYIWDDSDSSWISSGTSGSTETAATIKIKYESNPDTNAFTDSEKSKLSQIEPNATADQTASEIKTLYESNSDTNAFTDSEKVKLSNIEENATADQTGAEIKTLLEAELGSLIATLESIQTLTNKTIIDYTNTVHADAIHSRVKATENILKGQAVVITGYNSGEGALEIALADNTTGVATGIAYQNINVGDFGLIISAGTLKDVDTSSFTEGTILYVNSAGGLTATEPTVGFSQPIAYVLRSSANNGALQILADYPKQDAGDVRFTPYKTILSTRVQNAIQDLEDSKSNKSLNLTAGENLVAGDWCYLKSDGKMWKTNASAEATAKGLVVMATETIAADSVGSFQKTSTYTTSGLTVGSEYYLDTTAGAITTTKPTATGTIVRLVGYALSATELYLDIDKTYLENE